MGKSCRNPHSATTDSRKLLKCHAELGPALNITTTDIVRRSRPTESGAYRAGLPPKGDPSGIFISRFSGSCTQYLKTRLLLGQECRRTE